MQRARCWLWRVLHSEHSSWECLASWVTFLLQDKLFFMLRNEELLLQRTLVNLKEAIVILLWTLSGWLILVAFQTVNLKVFLGKYEALVGHELYGQFLVFFKLLFLFELKAWVVRKGFWGLELSFVDDFGWGMFHTWKFVQIELPIGSEDKRVCVVIE